jgi:hypothetical protein
LRLEDRLIQFSSQVVVGVFLFVLGAWLLFRSLG